MMLAVLPVTSMAPFLFRITGEMMTGLSLFYFGLGCVLAFYTIVFLKLAPDTGRPMLWAGMGRIIDAVVTVLCSMLAPLLQTTIPMVVTAGISWMVVIAVLWLMFHRGRQQEHENENRRARGENLRKEQQTATECDVENIPATCSEEAVPGTAACMPACDAGADMQAAVSQERLQQKISDFCTRFGLTAREQDVLRAVLESDAPVKALAVELGISERMFYRHMKRIYEKTDTESRAGVVKLYYGKGPVSSDSDQ